MSFNGNIGSVVKILLLKLYKMVILLNVHDICVYTTNIVYDYSVEGSSTKGKRNFP